MLTLLVLQSHQELINACLSLRRGAWEDLPKIGVALKGFGIGIESEMDVVQQTIDILPANLNCPMGQALLRLSPSRSQVSLPEMARVAAAAVLVQGMLRGAVAPAELLGIAAGLGACTMESRFELLVKAYSACQVLDLDLAAWNPVLVFLQAGESFRSPRGREGQPVALLSALEDLDPWRDATPKGLQRFPASHPLQRLCDQALPALFNALYLQAGNREQGMAALLGAIRDLWEHVKDSKHPGLTIEGAAYCALYQATRRELASPWGPSSGTFSDDLRAAMPSAASFNTGVSMLGPSFAGQFHARQGRPGTTSCWTAV